MKDSLVKSIADAVLYEGYLLYPYRPSAVKNQQRWNFGALCPESYSHAQSGTESWTMRTQVLIESDPNTKLNVEVRFLHLSNRQVAQLIGDCKLQIAECGHLQIPSIGPAHFAVVPTLEVDGKLFQPLQEAVEREVSLEVGKLDAASGMSASNLQNGSEATAFNQPGTQETLNSVASSGRSASNLQNGSEATAFNQQGVQGNLNSVAFRGMSASNLQNGSEATAFNQQGTQVNLNSVASLPFCNPAEETWEPLRSDVNGEIVGALIRRQEAIEGVVEVRVESCEVKNPLLENTKLIGLRKLTVEIRNLTPFEDAEKRTRDDSLMRSFVSTHTILTVQNGHFVSLLDPPENFRELATGCSNVGTYPVLVGEEGTRDCMLSSPIILYDYPQIAPESPGSLFDGTEIDEILTLRIMTLTDDEKREMRNADDRARQILERTETLPAEQFMKMHGAMKGVKKAGQ